MPLGLSLSTVTSQTHTTVLVPAVTTVVGFGEAAHSVSPQSLKPSNTAKVCGRMRTVTSLWSPCLMAQDWGHLWNLVPICLLNLNKYNSPPMFLYIWKINSTRFKVYLLKPSTRPNSYEDILDAETLGAGQHLQSNSVILFSVFMEFNITVGTMWLTSIPFLWCGFQTHSCCQGSPSWKSSSTGATAGGSFSPEPPPLFPDTRSARWGLGAALSGCIEGTINNKPYYHIYYFIYIKNKMARWINLPSQIWVTALQNITLKRRQLLWMFSLIIKTFFKPASFRGN